MIVLGPNLSSVSHDKPHLGDFAGTGFALELYINGKAYALPIYQDTSYWRAKDPDFIDYYLLSRDEDWPFEFGVWNFQSKTFDAGNLVRISAFLRALYTEHLGESDIVDFLRDFRALLHVDSRCGRFDTYVPICEICLSEELARNGFSVTEVNHHGRLLEVILAWSFEDDHPTWRKIHAGRIAFYVGEGKISKAAWKPHHWQESIEDLFWLKLKKVAPVDPVGCFASNQDLYNLLRHIAWEPTLTLSSKQLQEQRRQRIAESVDLWDQPLAVARVLLESKLYAESTSPHQIAKTVVRTIERLRSKSDNSDTESWRG